MTELLSAYGHSWVDSSGAPEPGSFMAESAARRLGFAIRNEGVAGTLSTETALLTPPPRSVVFLLMTGLNDARLFGRSEHAKRDYAEALRVIFGAFRTANPDAVVIALEQPHLIEYSLHAPCDRGSHESIDDYNAILRETAEGWPSVVVSPIRGWCAETMLDDDAVHPNRRGHAHLADVVVNRGWCSPPVHQCGS